MISRQEWGAVGSVPRDATRKTEVAIHHTVSPNRSWTKAQEKEHMRALERQHISQGWSTIGYSFVVFPSGRVYVGRGFTGLPAAQGGENSGTWAISLAMNGETKKPGLLMRRSVRKLIANLADGAPGGKAEELGGHREFPGQSTACPGKLVMPYVIKWRGDFGLRRPRN